MFLRGLMQHDRLNALADSVGRLARSTIDPETLLVMEGEPIRLRTGVWWAHLSEVSTIPYDIIERFQTQHRLPELLDQITREVQDASRLAQAMELRERPAGRTA